jgi:DNA-directed RNA polymerase beta subunit
MNLFNIVAVNDVPAYVFTSFPMNNIDRVINDYLKTVPDWDELLSEIQDTSKYKTSLSLSSFKWFYEEGLMKLIMSKSPIIPHSRRFELTFISLELREAILDELNCLAMGKTFACPLYLKTRLLVKEVGEIKEQDLFLSDIPMITQDGTFIVNGQRKVLLSEAVINRSLERSLLDIALDTLKSKVIKRMSRISPQKVTPSYLVDPYPFIAAIGEFFSNSLWLTI